MPCSDKNFIHRLKRGDESALEYIVDKFLPAVKGAVYKVLTDSCEREECIQDVFLSVWYHRNSFTGNDDVDFKRWIYKIAKYKAIDYYRKIGKSRTVNTLPNMPEYGFDEFESTERFMELLETLTEEDRKIFIMKYALKMPAEEIAQNMGITRSAVDNRIYRGKKIINRKIRGLEEVSI